MNELDDLMPRVLGMEEWRARSTIWQEHYAVRTVRRDGVPYVITRDHRTDRLNLTIEKGLVTGVSVG